MWDNPRPYNQLHIKQDKSLREKNKTFENTVKER